MRPRLSSRRKGSSRKRPGVPGYLEIAEMFADRYRREKGMDNDAELTEDDWYKASDVFLHYISGC